jgi:hypothetical protein
MKSVSPLQKRSRERNAAKWAVTGALRGLLRYRGKICLTADEHSKLVKVTQTLNEIIQLWEKSAKELGIGVGK